MLPAGLLQVAWGAPACMFPSSLLECFPPLQAAAARSRAKMEACLSRIRQDGDQPHPPASSPAPEESPRFPAFDPDDPLQVIEAIRVRCDAAGCPELWADWAASGMSVPDAELAMQHLFAVRLTELPQNN